MEFALRGALFLRLRPLPVGLLRYLRLLRNVAGNLFMNKTLLGRYALAIGSNEEATRLSGVKDIMAW